MPCRSRRRGSHGNQAGRGPRPPLNAAHRLPGQPAFGVTSPPGQVRNAPFRPGTSGQTGAFPYTAVATSPLCEQHPPDQRRPSHSQ